jgi:hypothetical protein
MRRTHASSVAERTRASSLPLAVTLTISRAPLARLYRGLLKDYEAILCGSAALALASAGYLPFGPGLGAPWRGVLTTILALAGFVFLVVACLAGPQSRAWALVWQRRLDWARPVVLALTILLCLSTLVGVAYLTLLAVFAAPGQAYISDMLSLTHTNAELVLSGHSPYASDAAYREALIRFPSALGTPLRGPVFGTGFDPPSQDRIAAVQRQYVRAPASVQGAFDPRTLHSYPALSFLLYVPVLWVGVPNILIVHLFVYVLLFAWLVWMAPIGGRRWAVIVALASTPVVVASLIESNEIICVALLMLAWGLRQRRWLGAILLGLACAYKQYAWGFVPFFVVEAILADGWGEAVWRGAIALGAFLLPNAPFLVASPLAWFASLWLPLSEPLFPQGMGVIALSLGHLLPYGSQLLYGLLEVAVLGATLVAAIRWRRHLGAGLLVLALIPLLFAFRSIPSYFAFAPWLALYAVHLRIGRRGAAAPAAVACVDSVAPAGL